MSRIWSLTVAVAAVVAVSIAPAVAADDVAASAITAADSNMAIPLRGSPVNMALSGDLSSCPECPRLYDNTSICTVNVQALPVGGKTPDPMSLRDWFVTGGGSVTGMDFFVINSGSAVDQRVEVRFYAGTTSQVLGTVISDAFFRTSGGPVLARIPAWVDPNTGMPGVIRVSVDYIAQTFNLVGLYEDEVPPGSGNFVLVEEQISSPVDQPIGTFLGRRPFSLPAGNVGVEIRFIDELSLCNSTPTTRPKTGSVLASGGPGTSDGLHLIGNFGPVGSQCSESEYALLCDDSGWTPTANVGCDTDADCEAVFGVGVSTCNNGACSVQAAVPCTGSNVCNLDLPFYGLAVTIYVGADSDETSDADGNNEINTADAIAAPAAGGSEIATVTGFLGDNGTPIGAGTPFPAYDHDGPVDADVDLLDWRHFQICLGRTDFDVPGEPNCIVHDRNGDGAVDLDEYAGFSGCFTGDVSDPNFTPNDPLTCSGELPPPPVLLQDVDIYRITGVSAGDVVSVQVTGSKGANVGPLWDPFLRTFDGNGKQIPIDDGIGGESDDFEPSSLDCLTTVKVPAGSSSLYVGISSASQVEKRDPVACTEDANCHGTFGLNATCGTLEPGFCDVPCDHAANGHSECIGLPLFPDTTCGQLDAGFCDLTRIWYDPTDPVSIPELMNGSTAGEYTLSIARTDADDPSSADNGNGGPFDCYVTKHEPDDTLADADAIGPIGSTIIVGAIGDGVFSHLGQDIDIYRVELDGDPLAQTDRTSSITATVKNIAGQGFQTTLDLVMALYTSDGELIATGDQAQELSSFDQTRPKFGANVCGSDSEPTTCQNASPIPGLYYLAVFASDRQAFDADGNSLAVAAPPSLLNFPHGTRVAATQCSDLRPVVGGRVNVPGAPLVGRVPPNPNSPPNGDEQPNGSTLQCYRIQISTCPNGAPFCHNTPLPTTGTNDVDELFGPAGNDSIPDASSTVVAGNRLGSAPTELRVLGNGHYGGFQGDVDFYQVTANPGDIVSLNIADNLQPPGNSDNRIRSYVALYDQDGFVFADHGYSLEHFDSNFFILDHVSDELAANVTGIVPALTGAGNPVAAVFAMVGIDNGNMLLSENTPFDAAFPGTTLSRRFQTQTQQARRYDVAITRLSPLTGANLQERMFAVARRGLDSKHTEPFVSSPTQGTRDSYPPLLELDPNTGTVVGVLDPPGSFYALFRAQAIQDCPNGCPLAISANPAIAYDGRFIWLTVERCTDENCPSVTHPLFKLDPTVPADDPGFVSNAGEIAGLTAESVLTGMVEINGYLYALDSHFSETAVAEVNVVRFWDKDNEAIVGNGGVSSDLVLLSATDVDGTEFDDVHGDIGTDGASIFVGCSLGGTSIGVCEFQVALAPDGMSVTFTFLGAGEDPITNGELIPGPRLGGIDILSNGMMVASDTNGTIVEYLDMTSGDVKGVELPREFLIERISARVPTP